MPELWFLTHISTYLQCCSNQRNLDRHAYKEYMSMMFYGQDDLRPVRRLVWGRLFGQCVGKTREAAGQNRDWDAVGVFGEVGENLTCALDQGGDGPPRREYACDHAERNCIGRETGVDELGGSFGSAQPYACSEAADHADAVDRFQYFGRVRPGQWTHLLWGCPFIPNREETTACINAM